MSDATTEDMPENPVCMLTLARLEAAYGPLLVVIATVEERDPKKTDDDYERWGNLMVDSVDMPRQLFQRVVAVFKEGVNEPMNQFTAIKTKVVDPSFDFEALSRSRGDDLWRKFFGGFGEAL